MGKYAEYGIKGAACGFIAHALFLIVIDSLPYIALLFEESTMFTVWYLWAFTILFVKQILLFYILLGFVTLGFVIGIVKALIMSRTTRETRVA